MQEEEREGTSQRGGGYGCLGGGRMLVGRRGVGGITGQRGGGRVPAKRSGGVGGGVRTGKVKVVREACLLLHVLFCLLLLPLLPPNLPPSFHPLPLAM